MTRVAIALLLLAAVACSRPPTAEGSKPDAQATEPARADMRRLPSAFQTTAEIARAEELRAPEVVHFRSGPYQLVGFVYRPNATGPAPAVVYNHGSEADPSLDFLGMVARFWQARGFVAFVPFRRGSSSSDGASEGPHWQSIVDTRPIADRDHATVEQLDAQVDDVLAAVGFLAGQAYVDRRFVAVGGCSFGGIETVLTAERAEAVYAGLDFAGASWTWASNAPLRERMTASARASRVPIMFLQAENDNDTTPSKMLAAAMQAAGKPATLKIYPPYGKSVRDGHAGFCVRGMPYWGEDALAFLRDAALRSLPPP